MPLRHHVREHARKGRRVTDYFRGHGTGTAPYNGEYHGEHRMSESHPGVIAKIRERLEEAREDKQRADKERASARSIAEAEAARERDEERVKHIKEEEYRRAHGESGLGYLARKGLSAGVSYARGAYSKPARTGGRRRRPAARGATRRVEIVYRKAPIKSKPRKKRSRGSSNPFDNSRTFYG